MLADGRSSRLYLMLLTLCFIRSAPAETPQQLYSHVTVGTLPNGLRYAILEDHREPVASLVIRLGVGSKDEEPDEAGYAHFFEHLFFIATPSAPAGGMAALEALGATDVNAVTNQDRTVLYETLPVENLAQGLQFEADRLSQLGQSLTDTVLKDQLAIIDREARQKDDNPNSKLLSQLATYSYPGDYPYSRPVLGIPDVLHKATVESMRRWYEEHYGPASTTIAIAGDVTPAAMELLLQKYFAAWNGRPSIVLSERAPVPIARGRVQLPASNLADSRIMAVWNLPGANSPDLPALKLLAKCLADGRNAFLETQLTAHGIHADIDESLFVGQLNSQLRISISLRAGDNVAAAEEILNSALSRFIRNGPDAADIRSANSEMSFAMATQRDRLSGPGSATDFLATTVARGANPQEVYREDASIAASQPHLQSLLHHWFESGPLLLLVNPGHEKPSQAQENSMQQNDRTIAEPASVSRFTLANGVKIALLQRPTFGLMDATISVRAPSAAGAPSPAVGRAALYLVTRRAQHLLDTPESSEPICNYIKFDSNYDGVDGTIHFTAPSQCLTQVFAGLSNAMMEKAQISASDIDSAQDLERSDASRAASSSFQLANLALTRALFSDSCRSLSEIYSAGAIAQVTADAIRSFILHSMAAGNLSVAMVGDRSPEWIRRSIMYSLGGLRPSGGGGGAPCKPLPPSSDSHLTVVDRPEAKQVMLVAASVDLETEASDMADNILTAIVGGDKSSRLNRRLREEKQWSYGVHSELVNLGNAKLLLTTIPVQIEHATDAIHLVEEEYATLGRVDGLSKKELAAARIRYRQGIASHAATTSGAGEDLAEAMRDGECCESANLLALVDQQDEDNLRRAAARLLDTRQIRWFIVGPKEAIMAQVRASSLSGTTISSITAKDLMSADIASQQSDYAH